MNEPTPEFVALVEDALAKASLAPDDAVRFMSYEIPVYVQPDADPDQKEAGGCSDCIYLGLWADQWPGFPEEKHGQIWLFEQGIRGTDQHLPLDQRVYSVLVHEMDHALQRNHVLEDMEAQTKAHGRALTAACVAGDEGKPKACG